MPDNESPQKEQTEKRNRRKSPFEKRSEEDFQQHVIGRRARRRQQWRRALRMLFGGALAFAALAAGFVVMETLLRVSETPLPAEATTQAQTEPPDEEVTLPAREGPPTQSFYLPILMLDKREQARALMKQAQDLGANTAVMPFKDANGWLTYKSNLMQQQLIKSDAKARYRTDWTLYDMKKRANQRVVAVIHCFDDPLAAGAMTEGAVLLRDSGSVPWKDSEGRAWLNPWSEAAREYLLAVIREVAAYGQNGQRPDDFLLCGLRFPGGDLKSAEFPGEPVFELAPAPGAPAPAKPPVDTAALAAARNALLREFIEEAREAAGEGAAVYVMIDAAEVKGNSPALGGDLWGCAADYIAVDVRGTTWDKNAGYWKTKPTIPVIATPEESQGVRDYIVLIDESQG